MTRHRSSPAHETQIQPALRRFAFLFFVLAVALPAIFGLAFSPQLHLSWVETYHAPALQREFGFTVAHRELRLPSGTTHSMLVIDSLSAGGRFDRLGFKVGDAFVCLHHGPADFWGELLLARDGYHATFKVVAAEATDEGCERARSITIPGRSLTGRAPCVRPTVAEADGRHDRQPDSKRVYTRITEPPAA